MKASELRPCDNCGGKLQVVFFVMRVSQAVVNVGAVNEHLGLQQMLGGSPKLAEVFSSQPDIALVLGDKEPNLMHEFILCNGCSLGQHVDIGKLLSNRIEKTKGERSGD